VPLPRIDICGRRLRNDECCKTNEPRSSHSTSFVWIVDLASRDLHESQGSFAMRQRTSESRLARRSREIGQGIGGEWDSPADTLQYVTSVLAAILDPPHASSGGPSSLQYGSVFSSPLAGNIHHAGSIVKLSPSLQACIMKTQRGKIALKSIRRFGTCLLPKIKEGTPSGE